MKNLSVSLITLGCSKNTVESEAVCGLFVDKGYKITSDINNADIILIHTCSFIEDSQLESKYQIEKALSLKKKNKNLKVFVTGCLPQLLKEKFKELYPSVDGYVGTGGYKDIIKLIESDEFFCNTKIAGGITDFKRRVLSSGLPSAYIKISEGCNHKCSYCVIPQIRGKYKSRTIKSVVDEAKALADFDIKELNVIAQDTTSYGTDIYNKPSLDKLFLQLAKIKSLKWIRLLYAYPSTVTQSLLGVISSNENICNYMDIPVQHISKNILSKMYRPINTLKIIENIKKKFPDIVLRTSLITGFPGETKEDFKQMLNFVKQNYFEHIGIFSYSDQQTAPSFNFKNKIKPEIIEEQKQILAAAQYENVVKNNRLKINRTYDVLMENTVKNNTYSRAYFQAPEIDNNIIIKGTDFNIGTFQKVKIVKENGYDLIAKKI